MHVPDRVLRQFGMQQHQTEDVELVERIDARGKPGINWLEHHHTHIEIWGRKLQLVVTEEHKPELFSLEEHDRQTEVCKSHSMEDHEPVAHNTQGHMEQDLINLCYHLRGRLNEHLLSCTKPSSVYKMLADIDHTFGLYGLHHMLSTKECNTNGPSSYSPQLSCSTSSKTNPSFQSSRKRPLETSSSSQLQLHSPALPVMYLQSRHEQMQAQQSFSLLRQSSKVDESSSGDSGITLLAMLFSLSPSKMAKKGEGTGTEKRIYSGMLTGFLMFFFKIDALVFRTSACSSCL